MSQLDISIFYSHLFSLLLCFYFFSHIVVMIIINFYYNLKVRELDQVLQLSNNDKNFNNTDIILKILN